MKVAPVKTNEEHKPLSRWILATLIILPLVTVGTVRAQEDTDAVRAQVSAQDRASIYSLSNFRFHVLPANTKAGKASAGARTLTAMPESSGSAHPRLTITDPDPPTGWVANSSLDEQGFEIGDECQPNFSLAACRMVEDVRERSGVQREETKQKKRRCTAPLLKMRWSVLEDQLPTKPQSAPSNAVGN
jgi:hypothetical protein